MRLRRTVILPVLVALACGGYTATPAFADLPDPLTEGVASVDLPVSYPPPAQSPETASVALPPPPSTEAVTPPTGIAGHLTDIEPPTEGWNVVSHWKRNGDGTISGQFYAGPQFRPVGGEWLPIDPALTTLATGAVTSAGSLAPVTFGLDTAHLATFAFPGGLVTKSWKDATKPVVPSVSGPTVKYADIDTDADLLLDVGPSGVKSRIVLDSAQARRTWRFHLSDPSGALGTPVPQENESFRFSNPIAPDTYVELPSPFAYEQVPDGVAPPVLPGSAHQTVVAAGDGWDVTLSVDDDWLAGKTFPIVLDPSVHYTNTQVTSWETSKSSPGNTACGSDGGNCVGYVPPASNPNAMGPATQTEKVGTVYNIDARPARAIYKFGTSQIQADSLISVANLILFQNGCFGFDPTLYQCDKHNYSIQHFPLTASKTVNNTWNETVTATGSVLYTKSLAAFAPGTRVSMTMDVRALVNYWVGSGNPNYGIGQKLSSEPTTGNLGGPSFSGVNDPVTSQRPVMDITWSPPPGAPRSVVASAPSNSQVNVTYVEPVANGGPAVSSYTTRLYRSDGSLYATAPTCLCLSRSFTGVPYGSYYAKVYATNSVGNGPVSAASNTVTLSPAPQLVKSVSPVLSTYGRGQELTYKLRVSNPAATAMVVDSVSDAIPAGLLATSTPVTLGGVACGVCSFTGTTLNVGAFNIPGNGAVDIVYKAVAVGADRACKTVTNTATAANSYGSTTSSVPVTVCDSALGVESWWSYARQAVAADSDAMVNVANGNLVVQSTDSTPILARGRLAHVVRRTYNSQDTQVLTLPGSIGGGWQLNLGQTDDLAGLGVTSTGLSVPSATTVAAPMAVTMVDRDGTRHVFTFKSLAAPISLGSVSVTSALGALLPKALDVTKYANVCVDGTYTAPRGVHLSLYRYVGVSSSGCGSLSSGVVLGFAAVRPDRLRTEYSWNGRLLSMVDGSGVEMRYQYEQAPLAGADLGRLTAVYESGLKPTGGSTCAVSLAATCRATRITYPTANEVRVTDPAGRVTKYLLDGATPVSHLVTVVNPPESAGTSVSDRVSYTYDGFGDDCDGVTTNATGQLCSVVDARGNNSRFTYAAAALGPKRVATMRDRRGTTTTLSYFSSPDYVTADKGTHRTRYMNIDASGRVGEIDEGGTNDVYLHVTTNQWDTAGSTCRQPDNVVDNNLCSVTRSSLTSAANEVTGYVYNAEGGMLAQRKANPGGTPASLDTTFGTYAQYVRADGTTSTAGDTVAGSGNVTSTARPDGTGSPVLFAISDRTQMLPPRGNAAGAVVANFRTDYTTARSTTANPNSTVAGSACSNRNSGVLCYLHEPFQGATKATTVYTYDDYGQRRTMQTPQGNQNCNQGSGGACKNYYYTYYADTELDLSNGVSAGGWLRAVTDPNGEFVAFGYDRAGNIARTWDRNRTDGYNAWDFPVATAPTYTAVTRGSLAAPWKYVTSQRDPMGNTTTHVVDQNGNATTSRPARGNAANSAAYDVVSTYDQAGNLKSTLLPAEAAANKPTSHTYDVHGNRVSTTDPNGNVTVTTYDDVNRVSGTRFTRGVFPTDAGSRPPACQQTATTTADAPLPAGRLACTTARSYDGVDNLVSETDADHQVTTFAYDAVKRLVSTVRPRHDGVLTTLRTDSTFDADGHILSVCPPRSFAEGGATTCASTDPYGTHTTYDEGGRRRTVKTYRSVGGAALTTTWSYDLDGNATTVTDQNGRVTTNGYDALDRLVSQTVPRDAANDNVTYFTYDAVGNRLSMTEPGQIDSGTGADGDLTIDGTLYPNGYTMQSGRNFRSLTLVNGARVTIPDWSAGGNGRLDVKATGTITICTTCTIDLGGKGLPGGAPSSSLTAPSGSGQGAGPGAGGSPGAVNGGGGGGAGHFYEGFAGATTTGGGAGGAGGPYYGGAPVTGNRGNADLGSGGGAGGPGGTNLGGAGGTGGGYVHLTANKIVNNGTITVMGTDGAAGATGLGGSSGGGGGGGSGGDVWLTAPTLQPGSVWTAGGAGGSGGGGVTNGGNGSFGNTRYQSDKPGYEPVGRITAYSYDANNRPVDTVRAASSRDAAAAGTTSTNGATNIRTRLLYDADGRVAAELDPRAFTASVTSPNTRFMRRSDFDVNGRPTAMWSPRYDGGAASDLGLSTTQTSQCTTSPAPQAVSGVPAFPAGVGVCVTRIAYDPAGNKARITLPTSTGSDNRFATFGYTDDNLLETTTVPDPSQVSGTSRVTASTTRFDASGRPVKVTDALGHQRVTRYTADGKVASMAGEQTAPGVNQFEEYLYDADGHPTRTTTWLNHAPVDPQPATPVVRVSSTTYWTDGLKKDVYGTGTGATDPSRDRTSYTYDNTGNVTSVKSPSANALDASNTAGSATVHTYTHDNLLLTSTVPVAANGTTFRRTTYGYDAAGRKSSVAVDVVSSSGAVQASGGTQRFGYLPSDLLSVQTGRNGESISHTYDAAGRATGIVNTPASGGSASISATYYLDGLPRTVTQRGRTTQTTYDGSGAKAAMAEVVDATGARTATTYAYGDSGKLASATSDVTGTTQSWSYDLGGRPTGRSMPNGTAVSRTYNADDTVAVQTVSNTSSGATLARWDYAYDAAGRIRSAHLGTGSAPSVDCSLAPASLPTGLQCMDYDPAGRLAQFKDRTADRALVWDHNGNRLSYGPAGDAATAEYNADDTTAKTKAGPTAPERSYTYAPFGGQLTDGCSTDTYDGFDRMLSTTSSGAAGCDPARTVTYAYDGLDRQVSRTESGTGVTTPGTTSLFYDGLGESFLAEVAPDGATTDYMFVRSTPVAVRRTGSNAATQYLTDDAHTSVTTTLSTTGAVACSIRYDAFGGTMSSASASNPCSTGSTPSTLLYRAGRRDSATGSYQLGARTYDPGKGSFRTPDGFRAGQPGIGLALGTDPLTRNSYTYVNGDPINLADPDGHMQDRAGGGGWSDYEAFKKYQRKVEMAEAMGVPVELNGKPRPEKGKDSLGWAIGEARLNARCGGTCDWDTEPGFFSMDTLSVMGKAAANIPSGVGEGLVRVGEGIINTPSMVVQGYANIGQLIKNPSMSSDDLVSTPKAHLGHVPAVYKDPISMAAYNTMNVTTQVVATVATAKLPGKIKAARASKANASETVSVNVYHATTSAEATQGVVNGVNAARLNPASRFGRGLYAAEKPQTALAEMAHHGSTPTHGIRYSLNVSKKSVLDLTDPSVAKSVGYTGGEISATTQGIGAKALDSGYKAIKFASERGEGANWAILSDFDNLLSPQMITPI